MRLILLLMLAGEVFTDKFLLLHPFYTGSHVLTLHSVTQELIKRGHEVTTVRFENNQKIKLKDMGPKHTDIVLTINNTDGGLSFISVEEKGKFEVPSNLLWTKGLSLITLFTMLNSSWKLVSAYCNTLLGNQELTDRLKQENFDLALVDMIYNECGLALSHHLNLPTVGYWAFSFSSGECEFPAVATPPSHIPTFMSEFTDTMTFPQRVYNFLTKVSSRILMTFHCWFVDTCIAKHLNGTPPSMQLLANLNGVLINSNEILDYPRLRSSTALNIGGMQVSTTNRPLPKNILDFIDGAEHGIVLFSMGFMFNPKVIPKERLDNLLNAFARLPQRVIVKFEEEIESVPENVLALTFLPQQDILAHPKTKVFFTHCGMHGVMEAIYHGVPMVGMPVFVDQGDVATRMEQKGIVKRLDKFATEEEIYDAITSVSRDHKYKDNVMALSKLLRLWRNHPMDDAIWLLEFLSKTDGAPHLFLSAKDLNWIQYHSIDVVFFLVFLITFSIYVKWRLLKYFTGRKVKKD